MNLMITMILGGLWHGAGWTFIVWGTLHGAYLVINHAFRFITRRMNIPKGFAPALIFRLLTFTAVIIGWAVFRADSLDSASRIIGAMFAYPSLDLSAQRIDRLPTACMLALALVIVWLLPNTYQLMDREDPALNLENLPQSHLFEMDRFRWRPTLLWAFLIGTLLLLSVMGLAKPSEFLYYQF